MLPIYTRCQGHSLCQLCEKPKDNRFNIPCFAVRIAFKTPCYKFIILHLWSPLAERHHGHSSSEADKEKSDIIASSIALMTSLCNTPVYIHAYWLSVSYHCANSYPLSLKKCNQTPKLHHNAVHHRWGHAGGAIKIILTFTHCCVQYAFVFEKWSN